MYLWTGYAIKGYPFYRNLNITISLSGAISLHFKLKLSLVYQNSYKTFYIKPLLNMVTLCATDREDWDSSNAIHSYSGSARFEFLAGHRLS
jgi:hypothetical protein